MYVLHAFSCFCRELYSSNDAANIPWNVPKRKSKMSVLIGDDLQEDSSGDEYVPGEEEVSVIHCITLFLNSIWF